MTVGTGTAAILVVSHLTVCSIFDILAYFLAFDTDGANIPVLAPWCCSSRHLQTLQFQALPLLCERGGHSVAGCLPP